MALTTAHIMLIDILTDRIITATHTMKRLKDMDEEQVKEETAKWESRKEAAVDAIKNH